MDKIPVMKHFKIKR